MTAGVLFVENYTAGGSDQVARTLIEGLPFSRLTVMANRGNDMRILLAGELPPHVTVERYGLVTIPELLGFARQLRGWPLRRLFWATGHVLRYLLIVLSVPYFFHRIARTRATVFVANNGGYPAGDYCRSATVAASMIPRMKAFHIVHSMPKPARGSFAPFEWLMDRTIDRCCEVITVCRAAAEQLNKVRWISQSVRVIHNGLVPTSVLSPARHSGEFRILNIGYFDRNKNQSMLIRAVAELARRGCNNVRVHFVGADTGDGMLEKCRTLSADLGVHDRVAFEGFISDVESRYRDCDLFVLCSNWEGFPMTILEAMRAGKPVVATGTGGVKDQVQEGVNGFVVAPDDHLSLADRIESLVRDGDMLKRLGAASRATFEELYTMDRMISRYVEVLGLTEEAPANVVGNMQENQGAEPIRQVVK